MVCAGNSSEYCGGPNRLDVYGYGFPKPDASSTISSSTSSLSTLSSAATTEISTTSSTSAAISTTSMAVSTSTLPTSSSTSSAPPTTSSSTTSIAGWSFLGCYTDSVTARSLSVGMAVPGGPAAMTVELCQAACQAAGYVLAGVEYAQECYCDNTFKNGGGPAPDGNALCDMACNGNPAETCGGPDRLDAYQFNSSGDPTGTTTQSSDAATSTAPSTATGIPAGWAYYGCWVDNANGRIMPMVNDLPTQTIEGCIATCIDNGNYVAGLEYSTQCFCGDAIYSGGTLASSDSQCNMACGGNAAEICGAGNRMSVYSNQTLQVFAPAVPQTSGLPGSWTYQGCIT